MGKVLHLDLNDVSLVLDGLVEKQSEIKEICVIYETHDGTRRIAHNLLSDPLAWYGVIVGLAHNLLLHRDGVPLKE